MKIKLKYAIVQIYIFSPNCNLYNHIFLFLQTYWLSFSKLNYQLASGLYLGHKTLQIFACGGHVAGYGFAGDAIDRVYQLIKLSVVVDIFSCSRPILTLKTIV